MERGAALLGAVALVSLTVAGCGSVGQQSSPVPEAVASPETMSQEEACQVLRDGRRTLESDFEAAGIPTDSPSAPTEEPARSQAQEAFDKYRISWVEVRDNGPEPIAAEMRKVLTTADSAGFLDVDTTDEYTAAPADKAMLQDGYNAMLTVSSACGDPELFGQTEPSSDS